MSWLGGSLSSITGQISNLTKDILTEGTEETTGKHTLCCIANQMYICPVMKMCDCVMN